MCFFLFLLKNTFSANNSIIFKQCKPAGIFTITHFDFPVIPQKAGDFGKFSFFAEMAGAANEPIVELLLTKKRVPELRLRYNLCELGVLKCPTTFAEFSFGTQFLIPDSAEPGRYRLKIYFLVDGIKAGCFETPLTIDAQLLES